MKTTQEIAIKRRELDGLRRSIGQTLGPRDGGRHHGLGFGLVFAGFALGVIVERMGWRPVADSALSVNRWVGLAGSVATPVLSFLNS